jgi:hypothetical protein
MKKVLIVFLSFFILSINAQKDSIAQEINKSLVQLSGIVLGADSLDYMPFVAIYEKSKKRGTFSDSYGFFSMVARKGDTLTFSTFGMKDAFYVIPDTLTQKEYSLIQILQADTTQLNEVEVYPWPTKEELYNYLLSLDAPDDEIMAAASNMSAAQMANLMANMPVGGSVTYKHSYNNRTSQLYWSGQAPPINILNPIAWAQFVDAWRKGKFKKQ